MQLRNLMKQAGPYWYKQLYFPAKGCIEPTKEVMVILASNLVMNRNMSMCMYGSVHVCVCLCVFLSLCLHLHMSVGVGEGDVESVVRKESLQTITVLLLSTRAAGWGFLSDRRGICLVELLAGGSWLLLHSALIF